MQFAPSPAPETLASVLQRIEQAQPVVSDVKLLNGARFLSACTKDSPIASVALHFDIGSRRESSAEHGALHFFEHLPPASFRITNQGVNLTQFARTRCWKVNINLTQDRLTLGFICPDFDAPLAMTVLSEIINAKDDAYRAVFPVEKGRILNEIECAKMDADKQRQQFLAQLVMRSTGYAHPIQGTTSHVSQYSAEQILAIGNRVLSPENATVAISGDAHIISQAHSFFENMPFRGNGSALPPISIDARPAWDQIPAVTKHICPLFAGVEVEVIFPGMTTFDPKENAALSMLLKQLSMSLNQKLSHETGLSYGAGIGDVHFAEQSIISGGTNVKVEDTAQALRILKDTIQNFPATISDKMIEDAVASRRNAMYLATPSQNHGSMLEVLAAEPRLQHVPAIEYLKIMESFTVPELTQVAKRYLDLNHMRIILHGSEQSLAQAQLE